MSKSYFVRSAAAIAVSSVLVSPVATANNLEKFSFGKPLKTQFDNIQLNQEVNRKTQNNQWFIKLKTPAIAQSAAAFSPDKIASVQSAMADSKQAMKTVLQNTTSGVTVIGETSILANGLIVTGTEVEVMKLREQSNVDKILPLYDYSLNVAASAEYIKSKPLVDAGTATGKGLKVAVLDTGIDYTHKAFGGSGNIEDYQAAIADPADTPAWPQGQVQGGYDFINNDPDPIDVNTNHGTHVSHSVTGIAPEVELYVYSVCEQFCPGLAQFRALEAAMDPNGDGDISDRVDVVNMSLGGDFGDSQSGAVQELINSAVALGTNMVISAGNDGPTPFIVGGPSTTPNALSVGAMTHPVTPATTVAAQFGGEDTDIGVASFNPTGEFQFTHETAPITFLQTATRASDNQPISEACSAFADGTDFSGKAVLVDRGACNFTAKVLNAQAKGALFVIITNHTAGAGPVNPGGGADGITIPTIGISYELGQSIKSQLAAGTAVTYNVNVRQVAQPGAIAGFTSRGPSISGMLKPEITAPGTRIDTAHPGTGDGLSPATGTSFSGPITAGAITLLREAHPSRNALELKATIMNSANLDVTMESRAVNPDAALAPISYIGAGLVDMEKAAALPVMAWAKDTKQAALAFGVPAMSGSTELTKTVQVKNFSTENKTYSLALEQRYKDDMDRNSLTAEMPSSITVPAGQTIEFDVKMTVNPSTLPEWTLNASNMQDPARTADLTTLELDGAIVFSEGDEKAFHLVYHMLPKATAKPVITTSKGESGLVHTLANQGATALEPLVIPPTATSEVDGSSRIDLVAGSVETFQIATSFCASGYVTTTTFVTRDPIPHTYIGGFIADYDLDSDGTWDYSAQNGKLEWFRNTLSGTAISFTHGYGSGSGFLNNILHTSGNNYVTVISCIEEFGLTAEQVQTGFNAKVRFRTEEETWTPIPNDSVDSVTVDYRFAPATALAQVTNASGEAVTSIAVGESANIAVSGANFMMLSNSGSEPLMGTPAADAETAPVITADQSFSVDENTANDTVIGQVEAKTVAAFAAPVSEFIVTSSSSSAITVNSSGQVVVANSTLLDYDAGLTEVNLELVATDTRGNVSSSAAVTVSVKNLADEPSEQPAPAPTEPPSSGSGGGLIWLLLGMPVLAAIRRLKLALRK